MYYLSIDFQENIAKYVGWSSYIVLVIFRVFFVAPLKICTIDFSVRCFFNDYFFFFMTSYILVFIGIYDMKFHLHSIVILYANYNANAMNFVVQNLSFFVCLSHVWIWIKEKKNGTNLINPINNYVFNDRNNPGAFKIFVTISINSRIGMFNGKQTHTKQRKVLK